MDLDQIRKDIDQIDQELVALLERRMVCVGQIVEYKEQQGIPVLDQGRERELLEKVGSLVTDEHVSCDYSSSVSRYDEALERLQEEVRARDQSIYQKQSTTVCGPNRDGAFIGLLVGAIDMILVKVFS